MTNNTIYIIIYINMNQMTNNIIYIIIYINININEIRKSLKIRSWRSNLKSL